MYIDAKNILNPIAHNTLLTVLNDVKNPEQKIKYLAAIGNIQPVMRGWYVVQPTVENYSLMYAANQFYGPSYVSMLSALSYFGWLTDFVITQESICLKRGKEIKNKIGRFTYHKQAAETFYMGVTTVQQSNQLVIRIATPTKALYDYLITQANITFTGKKDLYTFLENDLRFATDRLQELDVPLLKQLMQFGKKSRQINVLIKLIESVQ
jgi:predicted transcriptional regulator of viral defense system